MSRFKDPEQRTALKKNLEPCRWWQFCWIFSLIENPQFKKSVTHLHGPPRYDVRMKPEGCRSMKEAHELYFENCVMQHSQVVSEISER